MLCKYVSTHVKYCRLSMDAVASGKGKNRKERQSNRSNGRCQKPGKYGYILAPTHINPPNPPSLVFSPMISRSSLIYKLCSLLVKSTRFPLHIKNKSTTYHQILYQLSFDMQFTAVLTAALVAFAAAAPVNDSFNDYCKKCAMPCLGKDGFYNLICVGEKCDPLVS